MSLMEQSVAEQNYSDISFTDADTKFASFSKTCSRVRENSAALPDAQYVPNSDDSGDKNASRTQAG